MKEKNFNYAKAMEQVKSIIKAIEENDMDVDAMVAKVEEAAALLKECRSKWLLGFFGEADACDCGMCDVCMNAKNGASPSRKVLADAILKALEAGELSINDIAQIGEEGAKANMLELRRLVESGKVVEIEGKEGFFKLAK